MTMRPTTTPAGEDHPNEPASPACLLHEVDPAYAGFLAGEALAAALAGLEALEAGLMRAEVPPAREKARRRLESALREVLRQLDDPVRIQELQGRLAHLRDRAGP